MRQQMAEKQIALHEEAITILSAVPEIEMLGSSALQRFIDRACAQMNAAHSPGHHIALISEGQTFQAASHSRQSDQLIRKMREATERSGGYGQFRERPFIVGASRRKRQSVLVMEFIDDLQAQVLQDSLRRFGGSALLAVAAAVIVNVVMVRIVVRPVSRLVRVVRQIRDGTFGEQVNGFRSRELHELSQAVNQMSETLAEAERQRRMQMARARRIQQNLLPPTPKLPDASMVVHFEPADDVAGDFYDVQFLSDGGWVVFLADVTGHGIPAAMNATLLKAWLAEACEHQSGPVEIMRHINRRFTEQTLPGDLATAVLIRRLPSGGPLQIVNAGHDAGLLRTAEGRLTACPPTGLLLGVDETADWSVQTVSVSPGDRLLLFTDGVTETFSADHTMFGRERLEAAFAETADRDLSDTVGCLIREVRAFRGTAEQKDDITVIALEFRETGRHSV